MPSFNQWLDTFLSEKEIDLEGTFEVEGPSGPNFMSYAVVVEALKDAPDHERKGVKSMMVKIDFVNGDIRDYLRHLAKAIAK